VSERDLALVRARVAALPPGARGERALRLGRAIAARTVLTDDDTLERPGARTDFATTPARWLVFVGALFAAGLVAGATHVGGRGGRLEPELGAAVGAGAAIVTVLLALSARLLRERMPVELRLVLRPILVTASIAALVGAALGVVRLALGESDEPGHMLAASAVQVACAVLLGALALREPRASRRSGAQRRGLDAADCRRLRETDPDRAQRLRDAEIQALLALVALGRLSPAQRDRASAEIDARWGASGEGSPST